MTFHGIEQSLEDQRAELVRAREALAESRQWLGRLAVLLLLGGVCVFYGLVLAGLWDWWILAAYSALVVAIWVEAWPAYVQLRRDVEHHEAMVAILSGESR